MLFRIFMIMVHLDILSGWFMARGLCHAVMRILLLLWNEDFDVQIWCYCFYCATSSIPYNMWIWIHLHALSCFSLIAYTRIIVNCQILVFRISSWYASSRLYTCLFMCIFTICNYWWFVSFHISSLYAEFLDYYNTCAYLPYLHWLVIPVFHA